jgi:hypothetical protein
VYCYNRKTIYINASLRFDNDIVALSMPIIFLGLTGQSGLVDADISVRNEGEMPADCRQVLSDLDEQIAFHKR